MIQLFPPLLHQRLSVRVEISSCHQETDPVQHCRRSTRPTAFQTQGCPNPSRKRQKSSDQHRCCQILPMKQNSSLLNLQNLSKDGYGAHTPPAILRNTDNVGTDICLKPLLVGVDFRFCFAIASCSNFDDTILTGLFSSTITCYWQSICSKKLMSIALVV